MHLIGFSHHYTKLHWQTYGELLFVRSTKPIGYRPSDWGIHYDTEYVCLEQDWVYGANPKSLIPVMRAKGKGNYPLKPEDFARPLLQLVFLGGEHKIPFTTYREFPKNYKPFHPGRHTYRKTVPYSDLIGDLFAFKFRGEKMPFGLTSKISTRPGSHVEIFR